MCFNHETNKLHLISIPPFIRYDMEADGIYIAVHKSRVSLGKITKPKWPNYKDFVIFDEYWESLITNWEIYTVS